MAPGQMERHYSPNTRLVLQDRLEVSEGGKTRTAFLFVKRPQFRTKVGNVFWFDARGRHAVVARKLFAKLRYLDKLGFDVIRVELAKGRGIADAINDRLRRAAAQ